MNKMKSIVKQVIAQLKGDDSEVTGQKILRQGDSALKSQIASLKGDLITLEDGVEDAKEKARLSLFNKGVLISDKMNYVQGLIDADKDVKIAEQNLADLQDLITFLEGKLVDLNKDEA